MCSYGGHIVPRPHDKSLFYAGGESRIVAVDRRTTAASLSALSTHLSRTIFNNRSFLLKYQLPNEDLDSLIFVINDEDLANMLEENDRITPPARIRLYLFPVKPESIGSALLDPKSESWFSDALKSTRILQKGQSADSELLMGIGSDLEAPVESGSNSGGGGDGKLGAESFVLETHSSFGSTSSSFSNSNSPSIGIANCDEKGLYLLDAKNRVPSSASFESENSIGGLAAPPRHGVLPERLIQVGLEESSESLISDHSLEVATQKAVPLLGYPLSQLPDGQKQQQETPLMQGGVHYVPQYVGPMPISPYHPVYQMPMPTQSISCPPNQPYPIYLVPTGQAQYHNMPLPCNTASSSIRPPLHPQPAVITQPVAYKEAHGAQIAELAAKAYCSIPNSTQLLNISSNATSSSIRPPLHPQTAVMSQPVVHKEVFGAQIAEMATKSCCSIPASTQLLNMPSTQGQGIMLPSEPQISSESDTSSSTVSAIHGSEFDEDVAYNQIYKTQPSLPVLPTPYHILAKKTTLLPEPSVLAKQQAVFHPQ